jgi:OmpA-OmpF porin, OOP family
VLPDISSPSAQAVAASKVVGDVAKVTADLQVTGARCDAKGRVVNRTGMTVGAADDGTVVDGNSAVTDKGVQTLGKDGGTLVTDDVTYTVSKDGSGTVVTADTTVSVDTGGSGTYVGPVGTFTVASDGSDDFVGDSYTYSVAKDGSGSYVGDLVTYTVSADGSGSWIGDQGVFATDAEGKVTESGAPVAAPPMPRLTPLGTFPKLAQPPPVGRG